MDGFRNTGNTEGEIWFRKTTLLNIVGALDEPSGGSVWIDGVETGSLTDQQKVVLRRKQMGFI